MAHVLKKDIKDVAADGPVLVFIVYPEALATMSGSSVWSVLFFTMLITLGLDSTFGGLEAMITGLCDQHPRLLRRNREIFVAFLLVFIWLCALPTTTYVSNCAARLRVQDQRGESHDLFVRVEITWSRSWTRTEHRLLCSSSSSSRPSLFAGFTVSWLI